MRIFHGRVADRKKPYDVYTIRGVLRQIGPISDAYHRHNIKIITIFRHRTQTSAWQALQKHFDEMKDVTIADLFAKDSDRFSKFSATFDDLMLVDFSKNRITEETLAKLQDLAKETFLADAIKSMFSGEKINRTEDRAVLHVALERLHR